jgi:hypothetical protein
MSAALRSLLTDSHAAIEMADVAESIGATLFWPMIAASYEAVIGELVVDAKNRKMARVS